MLSKGECKKCGIEEPIENGLCEICNLKPGRKRTTLQNRSLHLYFTLLAKELNQAGLDIAVVLEKTADVTWTPILIKEILWRGLQKSATLKESTTELTTVEVQEVYEILNRFLGEKWGVHVPWPNETQTTQYLQSLKKLNYEKTL